MGFPQLFTANVSSLGFLSIAIMVAWLIISFKQGMKKLQLFLFLSAHVLLSIDWFILHNDCYFLVSGIMLAVIFSTVIVKCFRGAPVCISKSSAIYSVFSIIPFVMFFLVLILQEAISIVDLHH